MLCRRTSGTSIIFIVARGEHVRTSGQNTYGQQHLLSPRIPFPTSSYLGRPDKSWVTYEENTMCPVSMHTGRWRFRILYSHGVAVRRRPSETKEGVTEVIPYGEIAEVSAQIQ